MRFLRVFFVFLFLLSAGVLNAFAQSEDEAAEAPVSMNDDDWQKTIDHVTGETKSLLTENEKLNAEYEFLQKKAASLRAELERTRAEVKAQQKTKKAPVSGGDNIAQTSAEMAKLQKEVEETEAENKALQKQLADIQEKNRLWKIQASQLENQKRDANLDLNYQKAQAEKAAADQGASKALQLELEQSLQEEKELTAALNKLTAQKGQLPKETAAMKKKNSELELRVKELKKQIAAQEKKNEKMQKDYAKANGGKQVASPELLRKKKELEAEVAKLTAQLEGVNATVTQSKDVLGKKRQLMDQIMYLDAENQALRSQIDEMLSQPQPK